MKKIFTIGLFAFFLLHDFQLFAQGDDEDGGGLEGTDPPAAPINSKLIYLALIAVFFAFYSYQRKTNKIN